MTPQAHRPSAELDFQEPPADDRFATGVTAEEFREAFRNYASGVAVITADSQDGPVGLTATSVTSVSLDPPLLVFSVSELSSSAPAIRAAETLVVHILSADQIDIAKLCATSGVDRFADTSKWTRLVTGEPFFTSASSWIRGRVVDTMDAGGSTIIAVQALQSGTADRAEDDSPWADSPLVYHNRTWHTLNEHSRI
ncbi:flavin reductase family protein [Arthrobacter sp. I2-34]|uniref:Flavin reductase family protein n=1 Tax=Arthrobacter hankyongi TaxID=2904801 RepID=A0ABS9L3Z1_9MICC|nr:flavin reductase family protein [Arthrobacter hankyongi]MCG2621209.1 flavin reductase family protein [Arthrobacter hankyongi]